MSDEQPQGLQRLRVTQQLPAGFEQLPPDVQQKLREKYVADQLEARDIAQRAVAKSMVAEHDLAMAVDTVQNLDAERKVYSHKATVETGSGRQELKVRGGDTRFIIPILIVIGVIVVVLIALFAR